MDVRKHPTYMTPRHTLQTYSVALFYFDNSDYSSSVHLSQPFHITQCTKGTNLNEIFFSQKL
jgi:hypothetical protein